MEPQEPYRPQQQQPPAQPPSPEQPAEQPQASQSQPAPQTNHQPPAPMYWSRPLEPQRPAITPEIQKRADESRQKYPHLNLSEGEYVISDISRHPIGLVPIWGGAGIVVIAIFVIVGVIVSGENAIGGQGVPTFALGLGAALVSMLAVIGAAVGTWVYKSNRFYLTNESVVQNLQYSLFSSREQTVSLGNIEDASYTKRGILQHMFDYGSLRLSTEGDETTYRFHFATNPKKNIAILNNAVESFKMGRPVEW